MTQTNKFDELLSNTLMDCKINPVDGSITGYVDTEEAFKDLMTNIQICGHCYSIRGSHLYRRPPELLTSTPTSVDDPSDENVTDSKETEHKFPDRKSRKNIHFRSQQGAVPISYFRIPFSIVRNTYFECSQGPKYYKKKIPKENIITETGVQRAIKRRNRTSKKMNCPALILIKCIRVYPEFATDSPKEPHWKHKKEITTKINEALSSNQSVHSFLRYFIKASPQKSHSHESDKDKSKRLLAVKNLKRERILKYKLARKLRLKSQVKEKTEKHQIIESGNTECDEECLEARFAIEEVEVQLEDEMIGQPEEHPLGMDEEQVPIGSMENGDNRMEVPMESNIDELLLSLHEEAQKIVNLSATCNDAQTISQSLALLQEAAKLLEEPPPETYIPTPGTKTVSIPVQQVYTNSSENYFTFTLDQEPNPTCVVFVQ